MKACRHVCMYVRMYVCMYVCMCVCVCVYVYVCVFMYACMYVCMYTYTYVFMYKYLLAHPLSLVCSTWIPVSVCVLHCPTYVAGHIWVEGVVQICPLVRPPFQCRWHPTNWGLLGPKKHGMLDLHVNHKCGKSYINPKT